MLIAVPIGIGIAVFLTELCPMPLRRPIGIAIELLAGIPSIIYGIWGLFFFAPFLQQYVQPVLINDVRATFRCLTRCSPGRPTASAFSRSALILAIMVLPFITAICRDVFDTVPPVLKEAAYGLGCTTREVVRNVVIPYTRVGIIGGVMLGLGRALGETMAVTFVIGNAHRISASLLAPGTTISATIANEFTEAVGDLYTSSLIALGLILFFITFVVLALRAADADAAREESGEMTMALDNARYRRRSTASTMTIGLCCGGDGAWPGRSRDHPGDAGVQGLRRPHARTCSPR